MLALHAQRLIPAGREDFGPGAAKAEDPSRDELLDRAVAPALEQLGQIGRLMFESAQPLASLGKIDGSTVVRIDQREVPELRALINIRHARCGQLEQHLRQPVDGADESEPVLERQQVG